MRWKYMSTNRFSIARQAGDIGPRGYSAGLERGFMRLWQFRIGGENAVASVSEAGPLWRKPRLARVEAALFLAREPLTSRKIAQLANLADGNEARTLIRRLRRLYDEGTSAFQVEEVAGGYQLLTRRSLAPWLRRLSQSAMETRLSPPAMETLAVVAYRQPVLRAEVEAIRGVHCDEMLRQLLDRDLIRIAGRAEDLGRPLLYGTTKRFLELFGLRHLDELPRAAEFRTVDPIASEIDSRSNENSGSTQPGESRTNDTTNIEPTLEEKSVTTRIRPAALSTEFAEEPLAALAEAAREQAARAPLSAAKEDEDEEDDDEEWEDDDDDDDDDDEDDEEDDEEEEDGFVDDEWEEVDDDDEDEEDEEDDDEEWEDDDDEEWEDDEDDDEDDDEEDDDEEDDDEEWEDEKGA
jgi:segregation and condensation protein B